MRLSEIREKVKTGTYQAPLTQTEVDAINKYAKANYMRNAAKARDIEKEKIENEVNTALKGYNERISQMKQEFASKQPQGVLANNVAAYGSQADTVAATAMTQWLKDRKVQDDNPFRYEVNDKWNLEQKAYLVKLFEEDPEKAYEFAADVNTAIENDQIYELGKKYPIMGGIVSLGTNVGNVIEAPLNYVEYGFEKLSGNTDAKLRRSASADITNNLRSGGANSWVSNFKIGDFNAGGFVYNGVLSFLDSAIAGLSGSGVNAFISSKLPTKFPKLLKSVVENLAGGAQLGLSAAASASNDVLDRGGSSGQAIATGAASWLFESLGEALSLGEMKWFSDSGKATLKSILNSEGKNWLKKFVNGFVDVFGKPMLVNAGEETLTEAANIVYDTFVNADISQYAKDIEAYMAQGMSEEEARQKANENIWAQVGEAAASGAFIGLLSGGGNMISNSNRQRKLYDGLDKTDIQQLVLEGLQSPEGSKAKVLAQKIQNKINAGKNVSTREIASLVATNENQYHAEDIAKIKSALQSRLTELGEKGNVEALSSAISKDLAGEQLTKSEQRIISESRFGQRVLNEATAENVESGEYSSGWAEKIGTERINSRAYNLGVEGVDSAENNEYNNGVENTSTGGNINGSQNAELLAGGKVSTAGGGGDSLREQSPNTAIIRGELGALSGNQGADVGILAAGTSGWISGSDRQPATKVGGGLEENFLRGVRGVALKDTDTIGRQLSPELKERLKDTVFRDEEGRILSFFHWTPNSFETFKYGDGAFHFGTLPTAISAKGQSDAKVQGNFKEVYINSKNPLVVYDDGSFSPSVIGGQLVEYGLMSNDDVKALSGMQGFYSNDINSEACQYMLEYIKELGFDSYLYVNKHENTGGWSVGVFDASQIITVAENGVIKENSGVTEADSSESANFMPENSDLQSTAEEASGITEPDISLDTRSEAEQIAEMVGGSESEKTVARRFVRELGKALGIKVVFEDTVSKRGYFSDGYIDAKKVIHIDYANKNPIAFLFRHEMVHYGSGSKFYKQFVQLVYNSKQFEKWLQVKTKMPEGSSVERMAAKYKTMTAKAREDIETLSEAELQEEMIADFAGSDIFTYGGSGLKAISTEVNIKKRNAVSQWITDFISWIKKKISKVQGADKLTFELSRIEDSFNRMISDAKQNPTDSKLKHSIDPNFARKYDEWDKKTIGSNFRLGKTSDVLKKLGVDVKNIYWDKSKIVKIKKEHPAMTDDVIKQVPNILEYPILVMKSKTVKGRLTLFGEVYDTNNNPVLAILELNPKDKNGHDLSMIKVASAYGKDANPQRLIDTSEILYVDENKNRTNKWLTENGLQLPNPSSIVGSINSITHKAPTVNSNSMQETENNSQDKIRRSVPVDEEVADKKEKPVVLDYVERHQELFEEFQNGKITAEEYKEMVDVLFKSAGDEKGTIPKGETVTGKENFDNPVPLSVNDEGNTQRFVRTVLEGGQLTEEMVHTVKQQILSGAFTYEPTSNEKNFDFAKQAIAKNAAEGIWEKAVNSSGLPNKNEIAIGEALLKQAVENNDAVNVIKYTAELADMGTRLGQSVQALSLLKRMDGVGQLVYVKRAVDTLNNDLQKRFKSKAPVVEIDENMATRLAQSKTVEDIEITYGELMNDIAAQVPATFLDKWNAWRYMAMLCNPTTHIRNLTGNAIFVPAIGLKNVVAAVSERAFVKAENRTKSVIIKKAYKEFAGKDFDKVFDIISSGGKMNPQRTIADNKPIFKNKTLESLRKSNFDLLEKEHVIFLKKHYKTALAGFLQARNVNLSNVGDELLSAAREYAILEAQKATYRDANGIANAVQQFSNKNEFTNIITEGVLPFKKTPMNIIRRGIDYSPIGIIKTLGKAALQLKSGEFTATQFIDGLAAGLTGTGIMALGMLFSSLGIAVGGFGSDDEDKFKKLNGEQEYAIRIGDVSYTIDWAAPVVIPFFIGVAINEMSEAESNETILSNLGGLATAGLEPIINLSMLSGIQETIAAARYADADEIIYKVAGNVVGSYFTQSLPTIGGKVANTVDDTRRSNYIDKTSNVPTWLQSAVNTVKAKVPVLSSTRPEYIDAWGKNKHTGSSIRRFFQNFLSPGYISEVSDGELEKEITRLVKSTGEASVIPDNAPKYFKFKKNTKNLNAEEYELYASLRGGKAAEYVSEAISSKNYAKLTDAQKADAISNIYKYCNAYAKASLSYTYEEVNLMYDGKITREKYNKLSANDKKVLLQEYFLDGYSKAFTTEKNGGSVPEFFIKKAKSK